MKLRRVISLFMACVFLQYFAGTSLFIHCHKLPTRIIVHSHPFPNKPHNHSDQQIECLKLLSEATCVVTPALGAPHFFLCAVADVSSECAVAGGQRPTVDVSRLRAPPVC